jgi:hypothetical protein
MKKFSIIISFLLTLIPIWASRGSGCGNRIFTTSKSFDIIASLQYFDKIKDVPRFCNLATDSAFMSRLSHVNENVKASKLCNFYSIYGGDKNDIDSCVVFFNNIRLNDSISRSDADWIKNIVELQPEITYCISALDAAGYSDYWDNEIKPILDRQIDAYPVSEKTIDDIHDALTEFSGPERLSPTRSNTYILNIDNAFNLSDESFCCTPLLLDVELEKKFRLDFLKVYTHENLHRLSVSNELMSKLDGLMADDFYRENEKVARRHNEGRNEAFVVAAEAFISHKIGRRDDKSVYDEFKEYVDGSLVLAPIIYAHLPDKQKDESLNSFILRLFDNGTIKIGSVKADYDKAMRQLESKIACDER